jgi:CheY-like chemotaxis protein
VHGGLGVGLALVKELVELHGGQVRAESAGEQRGATFTVDLPWGGTEEPAVTKVAVAEGKRHAGTLSGVRVLIVDDEEDSCEALRVILERQGAVVAIAMSVADALGALELSLPDVILSDVAMPGASGHDLIRQVIAERGGDAPPAAAISGSSRKDNLQQVLASGFHLLLEKPVAPAALVESVVALAEMTSAGKVARATVRSAPS